jgi:Tol biopolymer transport system component
VALPTGTPASIRRLLLRCLAKDPRKRLRDIGDARLEIDATDEEVPGGSETSARTPRPWMMALAIAAVGVSLLPAAVRWLTPLSIDSRLATAVYTHLTEWEGAEMDAAISRDGRFVAFVADRAGPFHTFLTQVGTEGFRDLSSGNDNERNSLNPPVGFSADGSELFLSGSPYSRRRLRKMAFTGGAPSLFLEERAISMAWSPDGARLVYFTATPADGDPLFVADRTGGNAHNVLPGKDGEHNHFPTWSPDSRWIYYVHFTDEPDLADLWRLPASGGTPERLTEQHTDVRYPTPIDDQVLYVSHAEDRSGPWLWAVDVERKRPPRRVRGVGPDKYLSLAASADGRRLVTTVGASTATLWSVPIGGSVAEESDVRPYQMPAPRALAPRFANPWLFYLSSGGFADGLWRLQDGNAVQVWKASDGGLLGPAAVSTDGQVAVTLRTNGRAHLVVVSADGAVRRSLANGIHVRGTAAWSPDGKWIVTGGRDDEGVPGLFKIPADGREPMRLVTGQAVDPVWSPDGNLIVYAGPLAKGTSPVLGVDPHGRSVTLPPIRTGAAGGDCGGCLRFLPDGKGLVYILGETGAQGFWLLDLITNTFRPLARLSSAAATRTFDITPDGRQIVFDRIRQNADIVLIDLPKE